MKGLAELVLPIRASIVAQLGSDRFDFECSPWRLAENRQVFAEDLLLPTSVQRLLRRQPRTIGAMRLVAELLGFRLPRRSA
jgi:hypothetical protein